MKLSEVTYTLNDGNKIPALGFGTMSTSKEAILEALKIGYRHLDTAAIYNNEDQVGAAIKESGIPREEIFVTTKLWNTRHKDAEKALDESLEKLGLDYVDLYLIHWPTPQIEGSDKVYDDWTFLDTYKELQRIQKTTNKIKSLGVSNFTIEDLEKLLSDSEIDVVPVLNQVRAHPLYPENELLEYLKSKNIYLEAYSSLGGTGALLLDYEEVVELAKAYNTTPSQVLISWALQRGTIAIPRSKNLERVRSNFDTITFKDEDLEVLNGMTCKYGENKMYIY